VENKVEEQDIKIVLDLETTGLDYKREKIIEFAGVKLVNNQITEEFETLINPQQEIRRSSIEIHHITPEMVENAPTIEEAMPKILDFIKDYPIVAHNAIFDYSFLNQAHRTLYGERLKNSKIDTFHMFKEVFPDEPSHGLEALLRRFNINLPVIHRAMSDAKELAYVYPHLRLFYEKKLSWQFSQLDNIEYLFERYLRIQSTIQIMQSEMADLKSVFKLYFEENYPEITSTTGEILSCTTRPNYNYDADKLAEIIMQESLHAKAFKPNLNYVERLIHDPNVEEELRYRLRDCRIDVKEAKTVSIIKPDTSGAKL